MAGSGAFFRLFVILLGLSHLIRLKAVPVIRTENLMQGPDQVHLILQENVHKVGRETNWERWVPTRSERMDLQLDYSAGGHDHPDRPRRPP